VQSNTVLGPGGDAALLRIPGTLRGLALKVDSNPRACALDPYLGAVATVCEAALNVAATGARPAGITNCLNYGNPERPEIMWQFIRGVEGIRDAALAFEAPVVSGNVSFYNETEGCAIPPTPTIAMVGVLDDYRRRLTQFFSRPGDVILIVRSGRPRLAASEYAALFGADEAGLAPIDLGRERALVDRLIEAAAAGLIRSCHDVSDGGLAVALAEACFAPEGPLGAELTLAPDLLTASDLFGEGRSTIVISAAAGNVERLIASFRSADLEAIEAGRVTSRARLRIGSLIDEDLDALREIYERALPGRIGER
jgi:phosphoribosylformylglycinamidine synthase